MVAEAVRKAKGAALAAAGFALLFLGIAMILLPGPALVVVPLGLGILATRYGWARALLARLREGAAHRR